jgi:hypothetical protein
MALAHYNPTSSNLDFFGEDEEIGLIFILSILYHLFYLDIVFLFV